MCSFFFLCGVHSRISCVLTRNCGHVSFGCFIRLFHFCSKQNTHEKKRERNSQWEKMNRKKLENNKKFSAFRCELCDLIQSKASPFGHTSDNGWTHKTIQFVALMRSYLAVFIFATNSHKASDRQKKQAQKSHRY